jgi:hypothetical protein
MTCEELRSYFEDHLRDAEARSNHRAVGEHVATCVDCSHFVEEQRELGKNLRLVRESAPLLSESVDASVVLNYRQYLAEKREHLGATGVYRFHPGSAWAWTAIAAVVLVGMLLWLFAARNTVTNTQAQTAHRDAVVPMAPVVTQNPAAPVVKSTRHRPAAPLRPSQVRSEQRPARTATRAARSLPDGFRSLMYCDPLSCPEDMDVIRVQLPSAAMPRQASGFIQPVRSITADVLVGPDGIARGIRFEEIEF